jgi:nitrogen fixation protein NifU and related proteins
LPRSEAHVAHLAAGSPATLMYSEKVLDHFHHPRNVGEIPSPTAVVEATNPVCGDVMKLWIVVHEGKVAEAKFKTQGCIPAVACGSWLTEAIHGKSLAELASLSPEQIESGLDGLPQASRHASALAAATLSQILEKVRQ